MKNLPLDDDLADYLRQHEGLTGETPYQKPLRWHRQNVFQENSDLPVAHSHRERYDLTPCACFFFK